MNRTKEDIRTRIHRRIRKRVSGTADRPRLAIFRSQAHIYAQVINDETGTTLCGRVVARRRSAERPKRGPPQRGRGEGGGEAHR
jgi:ribosomal protein L18